MEIALSSLNQQFGSSVALDNSSQRQQQNAQQQAAAGSDRAQQNRNLENQSQQQNQTRAETNQRTPASTETARVINGEVLSSETRRVDSRESESRLLSRSANEQPSGEPDNRRITAQQAIQNFQENEDLVPANNQQRQVSGIIDTYV